MIRQPDLIDGGDTWGLADIQLQTYLSPSRIGQADLRHRPRLPVPERHQRQEARHARSGAPGRALVVLMKPGKWVIGALANNLWSFAGDSDRENVNLMTVQPFVNYNFGQGWYV